MILGDVFVYLLLIPVVFLILLPLAIFVAWSVLKIPMTLLRDDRVGTGRAEPALSS